MQYTTSFATFLAATLAMTEMTSASPMSFRQHGPVHSPRGESHRGVSLKQVRNSKYNASTSMTRHGAVALEKAYLKYNVAVPDELTTAVTRIRASFKSGLASFGLDKKDTGSAVATPEEYDVEYLTPVQIGTPAQTLNLDFDTGSSDLWVYSSETPSSEVNGQAVYDPSSSNTSAKQSGMSWSISYGDGSSSKGDVYYDTVSIGGLDVTMAVETATSVSSEFTSDNDMDGLLGLGFSNLNTVSPTQQKTFFDKAEGSLDDFVFTVDLKKQEPGTYNFGYIDNSSYTGDIWYTDVDSSQGYWMFNTTGYQVGSQSFQLEQIRGIADTGTTLLMLPEAVVTAYYDQVANSSFDNTNGGFVFPCDADLPDFTLGIGDGEIVIPGSYINYSPIDSANSSCYGGIQDDSSIGFAIFGDIALKAAFVVFEGGDEPRLGWASKNL